MLKVAHDHSCSRSAPSGDLATTIVPKAAPSACGARPFALPRQTFNNRHTERVHHAVLRVRISGEGILRTRGRVRCSSREEARLGSRRVGHRSQVDAFLLAPALAGAGVYLMHASNEHEERITRLWASVNAVRSGVC